MKHYINDEYLIVQQLLNTYLSIRINEKKHGWENIDISNPPKDGVPANKLKIILDLEDQTPYLSTLIINNWFSFFFHLLDVEEKECADKKATAAKPFGTSITQLVIKKESLLQRTTQAIRSFIIQQFLAKPETALIFKDKKLFLNNEMQKLAMESKTAEATPNGDKKTIADLKERARIAKRNFEGIVEAEAKPYHEIYFKNEIQIRDTPKNSQGKPIFIETTFDDYCNNVVSCRREAELLEQLIESPLNPTIPKAPLHRYSALLNNHSIFDSPQHSSDFAPKRFFR